MRYFILTSSWEEFFISDKHQERVIKAIQAGEGSIGELEDITGEVIESVREERDCPLGLWGLETDGGETLASNYLKDGETIEVIQNDPDYLLSLTNRLYQGALRLIKKKLSLLPRGQLNIISQYKELVNDPENATPISEFPYAVYAGGNDDEELYRCVISRVEVIEDKLWFTAIRDYNIIGIRFSESEMPHIEGVFHLLKAVSEKVDFVLSDAK